MRYFITLSYNGAGFSGWQFQSDAATVQECLEKGLSTLLGRKTDVVGAGRTDTGVNAIGYAAHFDIPAGDKLPLEPDELAYKLNAILPDSIAVHSLTGADSGQHARFSASRREYTYFLHRVKDPFIGNFSWRCRYSLDVDAMNRAASMLIGKHDFSCFEKSGGNNRTSICTVGQARWTAYTPGHADLMGFPCREGDYLYFRISADRFLRNMVRAIVGTLVDVGRGRRSVEDVAGLLDRTDGGGRSLAGESVPGHALFLSGVDY